MGFVTGGNRYSPRSQDFVYLDEGPVPVLAFIGTRSRLVDGLFERNFLRLGMVYVCLLRDQGEQLDDGKILHQPTLDLLECNRVVIESCKENQIA